MPKFAYIDAAGDCVATSTKERTLAEAQAKNPSIDSIIVGAPDEIVPRLTGEIEQIQFHAYTGPGDGSDISDWELKDPGLWGEVLRLGLHLSPPIQNLKSPEGFKDVPFQVLSPKLQKFTGTRDAGGFVTRWDWNPVQVDGSPGDSVICEYHAYTMGPSGAPLYRDETIEWMKQDGTAHPDTKVSRKWYLTPEKIAKEGEMRRGKLVQEARGTVYGFALQAGVPMEQVLAMVAELSTAIHEYVEHSSPALLGAIDALDPVVYSWLDTPNVFSESMASPVISEDPMSATLVTPRQYMRGVLNIYG